MEGLHWAGKNILLCIVKLLLPNRHHTIFGAFVLLAFLLLSEVVTTEPPARAANNKNIVISEEIIDNKIFQVDKVTVEAPPEFVWAILTNYKDAPRVYSKVTECQVIQEEGTNKLVSFRVKVFRDLITLNYTLNINENFPSSIVWSRHCGAFKANEGYWHLEPTNQGASCLVTYAKFVDGGTIPQYFVNKELKAEMPVILDRVRVSAEGFYRNSLRGSMVNHQLEPTGLRPRGTVSVNAPGQERSPDKG